MGLVSVEEGATHQSLMAVVIINSSKVSFAHRCLHVCAISRADKSALQDFQHCAGPIETIVPFHHLDRKAWFHFALQ